MLSCSLVALLLGSWSALLTTCRMTLQFLSGFILRTICAFVLFRLIVFLLSLSVQMNFTSVVRIFMTEFTFVVRTSDNHIVAAFRYPEHAQEYMRNHPSCGRDFELLVLPIVRDVVDINNPFNEVSENAC